MKIISFINVLKRESFMHRLNKLLIIVFTLLISDLNLSQSWEFIGGPTGIPVNQVIFIKDGRVICSTKKGVFISDDYGDNWKISSSSQNFNGIYYLTERFNGEIIASEQYGILKSLDRGENWFKISDLSYLNGYRVKIFESPIDSSLYFINDSTLYKSTDGGSNWSEIWQGGIIDGFMINEMGWMYISERYKNILISKDNGNSFSILPVGIDLTYDLAYLLYSDKHGGLYFMVSKGLYSIVHFGNNKLTYIENGWTNLPLGVTTDGDLIYKSDNCIALFEYSTKQSRNLSCPGFVKDQFAKNVVTKGNTWIANFRYLGIYLSNDAGKTWKSINTGLGYTESTAIEITTKGKFIVSAFSGAFWGNLYYSTDEGATWEQKNPVLDPVFYDIDKLNNGNLVATGSYGIFTADREGKNWTQRKNLNFATYIFVAKNGVAYTGTGSNGMMISRDNGNSWTSPRGLDNEYFSSFGESSQGRVFAGASAYTEGIYYSDDNGHSWSHINPFPYSGVYDFVTKSDSIYAGTSGGIYKSDDNGLNWQRISYEFIKKFELAPNGDLIGINPGEGIIISSDNGKNWKALGEELKDRDIRDMCFNEDNQLIALSDSGIFRNNRYISPLIIKPDYGAEKLRLSVQFEWSAVPSADKFELQLAEDSLFTSLLKNVSTSQNSATIRTLLPDKTYYWRVKAHTTKFNYIYSNIGKFSTAPPFSISQNYPNPFNTTTVIEFYVPYNSRIKLRVYNVLGELVENLIDDEFPEGKHTYNWDASYLSSGVYLLQIEGDDFNQVKKAVLLK